AGTSLSRTMMRMRPCCSASTPKGGDDQPMSTWPDIVCVNVDAGLPVATGFACTPNSRMKARTARFVDEPLVEYAIVFPAASLMLLIGDAAGTYQKRSSAPVVELAMARTGAPFEKAPSTPAVPTPMPMSTLPEMTACSVSPAPWV